MYKYHIFAFAAGFILDLIVGDPYCLPHPIRAIGSLISKLEVAFLGSKDCPKEIDSKTKRKRGRLGLYIVLLSTLLISSLIYVGAYYINPVLGCVIEAIMTYQLLATKCLKVESMKVYDKLENATIEEARYAVSMIVGRDTANLDEAQVAKAAVETVAENTSDGIIAPMLYAAIGGPVLGFLYKAVNTCDSMIGYKNDRFLDYGRAAAKLDDVVNFIPSRISAVLMILGCHLLGKDFDAKQAKRIFKRDRFNHASPNSAQTESVMAGALGLRLAGDTSYFGKMVKKPFIGDAVRNIENADIKRANKLLYVTAFICELLCILIMCLIFIVCR